MSLRWYFLFWEILYRLYDENIGILYHSCPYIVWLISLSYQFLSPLSFLSWSYLATLNSYHFLRSLRCIISSLLKILTSLRTNHTKVCSLMKNSVSYGVKKIRLNPSIDPFIIFRGSLWYARGINIEYYWTSAYLPSCEWYIWTSILSLRFVIYSNSFQWVW